MVQQLHTPPAVPVRRHLVGVASWADRARIASATAAAHDPGDWPDDGAVQPAAGALADEAVERRVGDAVQAGEQQRHVVIVKDSCKNKKRK